MSHSECHSQRFGIFAGGGMKKTGPQDPGTPSGSSLAGRILSWPLEMVHHTYGAVGGVNFFGYVVGLQAPYIPWG